MTLAAEWHWDAAQSALRFEFRSEQGLHASGRALFASAEARA